MKCPLGIKDLFYFKCDNGVAHFKIVLCAIISSAWSFAPNVHISLERRILNEKI